MLSAFQSNIVITSRIGFKFKGSAIYRVTSLSWVRVKFELSLSLDWVTKKMPFFYRIFFHCWFEFFFCCCCCNFYYSFFITGAGRYAPALGNETLHGRMLLESSVHMRVLEKQYFPHKVARYPVWFLFNWALFLADAKRELILWGALCKNMEKEKEKNGLKSVLFSQVLCPAVLVKTRVCEGCSISRAHKSSLRSILFFICLSPRLLM